MPTSLLLQGVVAVVVVKVAVAVLEVIENSPHNRWQSEQPIQSPLALVVLAVVKRQLFLLRDQILFFHRTPLLVAVAAVLVLILQDKTVDQVVVAGVALPVVVEQEIHQPNHHLRVTMVEMEME
jgi:hypothetical protein